MKTRVQQDHAPAGLDQSPRSWRKTGARSDLDYVRRLIITVLVFGISYFVWLISGILLLFFAAVLAAVLLNSFAAIISRYTPIPEGWALTLSVLATASAAIGLSLLFGSRIAEQITEVLRMLPDAINVAGRRLGVEEATAEIEQAIASRANSNMLSRVTGLGYTLVGALGELALVLVAAVYLAASPTLYRDGAAKLFPPGQHARVTDAMDLTANALRLWFAGQLVTMCLVGTVSGLAYWWIGLPSPLALGLVAGLTNFIPFLGPFIGAVPALILALATDMPTVLWTAGAAFLIQQLEGNVITPLVQKRAVSMPPVVVLFAIVVFGAVFGLLGVLLAVPLAVVLLVLVKKLWVRETLGRSTNIPGEDDASTEDQGAPVGG